MVPIRLDVLLAANISIRLKKPSLVSKPIFVIGEIADGYVDADYTKQAEPSNIIAALRNLG